MTITVSQPAAAQEVVELRAEEGGCEELREHRLVCAAAEPGVDLDPRGAGPERRERGRLRDEHRGALQVLVVIRDGREDHRHPCLSRHIEKRPGRADGGVRVAAEP